MLMKKLLASLMGLRLKNYGIDEKEGVLRLHFKEENHTTTTLEIKLDSIKSIEIKK